MYDHDVRWPTLAAMAIILSLGALAAEIWGLWFRFPSRPDLLWILAFYTVLRVPPARATAAFALCGLIRDLFLGPRLGSAMLAYLVLGWLALHWRFIAIAWGGVGQALVAGAGGFLAALARHALDYGPLTYKLLYRTLFVSLGDGVLTLLAYIPLAALLGLEAFRPWRARDGFRL